jgi:hypothetical protein
MSQYPENWDSLRRQIYERDNYSCQNCGRQGGKYGNSELHAHHITPLSQGGENSPENLITLCSNCHSDLHGQEIGSGEPSEKKNDGNEEVAIMIIVGKYMAIYSILVGFPILLVLSSMGVTLSQDMEIFVVGAPGILRFGVFLQRL